ncbi:putative pumilio homolog 7, chloroplastic [Phragmites australis]|uniref:putative pumilio homolog 7, chloroplastic n=1 Tax=Phragmites australis TaxID=29695 RepID=UPI002D779D29|nr:putative pumilio homolog 7, chloroplastic [Phragmites australis]
MSRIAWDLPGYQFLVRMVAEGGAAAAQQVFDEVAGEVFQLMVHTVGHALVEALEFWTDEQITRVLGILGAASPSKIVAAATNHAGSNILQTLVGKITGQQGHVESFTRTLAGVRVSGVLSMIEDMDGSHLILKCLDTFSAKQNLVHVVSFDPPFPSVI